MLSYDNRALALGSSHAISAQVSPGSPTMGNNMASMEHMVGDHMLSNGLHKVPSQPRQRTEHQHIWLITGPAGCGKSTVAQHVAESLKLPYIEGDEYHPPANIEKMSKGIPLTDQDRWDWLIILRRAAMKALESDPFLTGVVVTCSALKQRYRDVIRIAHYNDPDILVHFVFLSASEETLLQRVAARKGHYMGANMVHSQLEALEVPTDEEKDVIKVDVSGTKEEVEAEALRRVREAAHNEMRRDSQAPQ